MAEKIVLTAKDGHKLDAWRADPKGTPKGGLVVLHYVYGINDDIGRVCDQFAAAGYASVAPALYDRVGKNLLFPYGADGVKSGQAIYDQVKDTPGILADIAAAVDSVRPAGKVAVSGFCLGGTWTWVSASELKIDAAAAFYGSHIPAYLRYSPKAPIILHYGDQDPIVPVPDIEKIKAAYPKVPLYIYPGCGHGFFNPAQPTYNKDAAALLFKRTIEFFDRTLAVAHAAE
jgi:carboxymethylenebutenolidase